MVINYDRRENATIDEKIESLIANIMLALNEKTDITELEKIKKIIVTNSQIDIFYPVGSYYETSDVSFDPNTAWGGTWVLETAGQVHVSAGTGYSIGSTGGSTTHYHSTGNHTLTVNQIPSHTHPIAQRSGSGAQFSGWHYEFTVNNSSGPIWNQNTNANRNASAIGYTGGGQAHNHGNTGNGSNMQPYIAVNRWHRTA